MPGNRNMPLNKRARFVKIIRIAKAVQYMRRIQKEIYFEKSTQVLYDNCIKGGWSWQHRNRQKHRIRFWTIWMR